MNFDRINELEQFVEEFNKKMAEAHKNYEKKLEIEQENLESNSHKKKQKKKQFTENIFKEPEPWKPNNFYGKEFDKFKILYQKSLSDWEKNRIHLIKRSFIKQDELPKSKDFQYTKSFGSEFGDSKNLKTLSEVGKNIIAKFMKDNEDKIKISKEKEEEIYKYKHSKPPVELNPWKFTNHPLKEFSTIPADKVHSFKNNPKPKFLIEEPFRRPSNYGDYFEKEMKNL